MSEQLILTLNSAAHMWLSWMWPMVWQSTVLVLGLVALTWLLRGRSARLRYALWLLVPIRLVLPPTLALATGWAWWVLPADAPVEVAAVIEIETHNIELLVDPLPKQQTHVASRPATFHSGIPSVAEPSSLGVNSLPSAIPPIESEIRESTSGGVAITWQSGLFLGWVIGLVLLAARLAFGLAQAASMTRRSVVPSRTEVVDLLEACRRRMGLRQSVRLRQLDDAGVPLLIGIFWPTIILPQGVEHTLTSRELEAVFVHELHHVARRDSLVHLIQTVLGILYFFHPLVWVTNRILGRLREDACDEATVAVLEGNRRDYGTGIVKIAEMAVDQPPSVALGIVRPGAQVKRRLERILDPRLSLGRRLSWSALALLLVVGAVLLPAAARPGDPTPPATAAATSSEDETDDRTPDSDVNVQTASDSGDTRPITDAEAEPELHIAFIYEGNTRTGNRIHGERASVRVDRPGRSVVLFLGSYGSTTWNVEVTEKTRLQSVILGGREKQAVKGLDESVKVVEAFGRDRKTALYGYHQIDAAQTRRLIEQLARRTGVNPSSFHGSYRPASVITINNIQDDPRLDPGFPQVSKEKFPETSFPATHVTSGGRRHERILSVGEYTLKGPRLDTLRPVPGNYGNLAYDPGAKQWYGLGNSLFKLDLPGKSAKKLPLGIDAPKFSHPRAVTFDTKRNRVIVATLGGDGVLYAYSAQEKQWSVVGSLNGLDLNNLCYLANDDSLYGLYLDYDGNSHTIPTLLRLNAAGAVIDRQRLKGPFFSGMVGDGPHGGSVQLLPFGKKLVLIANSNNYNSNDGSRLEPVTYILLVDPKTSTAKLTWKSKDTWAAKTAKVARSTPKGDAPVADNDREIHAVCLYEGIDRNFAEVLVDRPGKKVTLFLSAYHACQWKVSVADGSSIERVILGGYEPQHVRGLPGTTKIESNLGQQRTLYGGHRIDQPRFRQVIKTLYKRTQMELSSCHAIYRPTKPFTIDQVVDDPLLAHDFPKPVRVEQLPQLKFMAPYVVSKGRFGGGSASWGEFTQAGPTLNSLKSIPKGVARLAHDPMRKRFYGLSDHDVFRVDIEEGTTTKMDLGMETPRLSWPSALTFDSKRRRLLVFASGLIYQCDVDNGHKWTVLCELKTGRGTQVHAAVYSAGEDAIFLIGQSFGGERQTMLTRLNAEGALIETTPLKRPILAGMFGRGPGSATHLLAVKNQLVLLVYPRSHEPEASNANSYMFLIDSKTKYVALAWKR